MAELRYATLGHFILLIYMDSHDLLHRFHDFIGILSAHIFVAAQEISLHGISYFLSSSNQLKI